MINFHWKSFLIHKSVWRSENVNRKQYIEHLDQKKIGQPLTTKFQVEIFQSLPLFSFPAIQGSFEIKDSPPSWNWAWKIPYVNVDLWSVSIFNFFYWTKGRKNITLSEFHGVIEFVLLSSVLCRIKKLCSNSQEVLILNLKQYVKDR